MNCEQKYLHYTRSRYGNFAVCKDLADGFICRINFAGKRTENSNLAGPNGRNWRTSFAMICYNCSSTWCFQVACHSMVENVVQNVSQKDLYLQRQRASYQLRPFVGIQTLCKNDSSANGRHRGTEPTGKTTWISMKETYRKTLNKIQRDFPMDQPFCRSTLLFGKPWTVPTGNKRGKRWVVMAHPFSTV